MRWLTVGLLSLLLAFEATAAEPPRASLQYRNTLIRTARFVWGMDAPIPMLAAQIETESAWRPGVSSRFASGLTQFTPRTAAQIAEDFPNEVGFPADVFNPGWAMRAQSRYMKVIYDSVILSACDSARFIFTTAGYNGGPHNIVRDRILTEQNGHDPTRWWGNVELFSNRADWAMDENRMYPIRIWDRQPKYAGWGTMVPRDCEEEEIIAVVTPEPEPEPEPPAIVEPEPNNPGFVFVVVGVFLSGLGAAVYFNKRGKT